MSAAAALVGVAVISGRMDGIDQALRRHQRHPRGRPRAFALDVKRVARPEVQLIAAAVAAGGLHLAGVRGARAVLIATATAFAADRACKQFIRRKRPSGYRGHKKYESFPSGHTASTTALSFTLAQVLERARVVRPPVASLVAMALTVLVAESRLMLDEHWPSDVVAGMLLGGVASSVALTRR